MERQQRTPPVTGHSALTPSLMTVAGNKNKNWCSFETAGGGKRGGVGWGRVERMGGGGGGRGRSKVVVEGA